MKLVSAQVKALAAVFLLVVAAACSGGGDDELLLPADEESSETAASPTSSSTTTASTTTTRVEPDLDALEALWASLLAATEPGSDEERIAAMEQLGPGVDPDIVAVAPTWFFHGIPTNATPNTVLNKVGRLRVEIEDCVYYDPGILSSFAHHFAGVAEADDDGNWIITEFHYRDTDCVPADTAQAIYDDYDEFWEASYEYWTPPLNPNHPGIDQTMTGDFRELIRDRIELGIEEGWYLYDHDDVGHPEITRLILPTRVEITDCREISPLSGVFDAEGERALGSEPAPEDDRDKYTSILILEGGQWKVETIDVDIERDCETGPTHLATPVVG